MLRALVNYLRQKSSIFTSKPSFLTDNTNQESTVCQEEPEDEMAGVGAAMDQVTTPVESSATEPELPSVEPWGPAACL